MTLLSSCLRFPVYCACNRVIYTASKQTLLRFVNRKKKEMHSTTGKDCIEGGKMSNSRLFGDHGHDEAGDTHLGRGG